MKEQLKVVLMGAASPQWGHKISRDLIVSLSEDEIQSSYDPVLVMEDVDETALRPQTALAELTAEKLGSKVRIESSTDQRKSLEGARFVIISFAVGSLEAMQPDIEIPREYGIYMPVGDTFSIGGAIRAARNIPSILSIAKDIEEVGHEKAWILNLANPMSILTRAITRESKVQTIGCCHELYGGLRFLADQLGFDNKEWRARTELSVCGINHCGWMKEFRLDGKDGLQMLRDVLAERGYTSEKTKLYNSELPDLTRTNVKINLFLRHGILPYSGDRHNVEFFTEFVNENTDLGADYGVLLTSLQERKVAWRGKERAKLVARLSGKEEIDLKMSNEAAGRILPALLLGRTLYDVGNLPYYGDELSGVPQGAVLERMVTFSENKVVPDPVTPLPQPVQEHLVLISGIIEDYVEAAVSGNRSLMLEALGRDPLLKNMDPEKIPEMTDRLLEASREYVHPGFF